MIRKGVLLTIIILSMLLTSVGLYHFFNSGEDPLSINENPFKTHEVYPDVLPEISGTKYYFSSSEMMDGDGLSPETPSNDFSDLWSWDIQPGDAILLQAGAVFTENIYFEWSGTPEKPIVIAAYWSEGSNLPNKPVFQGNHSSYGGIMVEGAYVSIYNVEVRGWITGIDFLSSSSHSSVQYSYITDNIMGVAVGGNNHLVSHNTIKENQVMMEDTPGGDDDYGAQGVLLSGNYCEVAYNYFEANIAPSDDYGYDGSAVEVYQGSHNYIHHNFATNGEVFTELGQQSEELLTVNNTFEYNIIVNERHNSLFVQHCTSHFGPVYESSFRKNIFLFESKAPEYYGPVIGLVAPEAPFSNLSYYTATENLLFSSYHPIGNYEHLEPYISYFSASNGHLYGNTYYLSLELTNLDHIDQDSTELFTTGTSLFEGNKLETVDSFEPYQLDLKLNPQLVLDQSLFYQFFNHYY